MNFTKLKVLAATGFLLASLTACNDTNNASEKETNSEVKDKKANDKKESKYPFPQGAKALGESKVVVSTPSGDSSDGSTPVIFTSKDDLMVQIGLDLENFQGDKETFVYVNEVWNKTEQVSSLTQTSLDLEGDLLKPGKYTVSAVEYEDNDPNNKPVTYVETNYEVKQKSE